MTTTTASSPPNAAPADASRLTADARDPANATGHILVVDDNEMNRDMLSRRLRKQGHSVETAVNGREALDRLAGEAFDLVLLDIMMPEMNGYEALGRIRSDDELCHLPVILISALDDTDSIIKGIEHGADDHLPKPFNAHILRARVDACLAKKRLRDREQLYARALAREIDIGREIQAGFFPDDLPSADGWQLAAHFRPARSVAGDFYDAFRLDDGRIALVMADVCGKGVGAALFMALFRTLLRSLAPRTLGEAGAPGTAAGDRESRVDPAEGVRRLMSTVNDYIAETHGSANMFATVFLGVLDPGTGELVYASGGHDAPVVTAQDGIAAILAPTGPAVGMLPDMTFESDRVSMTRGQTLVAFTDGVIDARSPDGATFSNERLLDLLAAPGASAEETLDRVRQALREHTGDAEPFDDVTVMVVRRA